MASINVIQFFSRHQLWSRRRNSVNKNPKSFHITEKKHETLNTVHIQSTEINFLPQIN